MPQTQPWCREIRLDEIPEDLKDLVEIVGMEAVLKMMEYMGGGVVYIPARTFRMARNRYILERFNGDNAYDLARETGVTLRHVYRIVRGKNS